MRGGVVGACRIDDGEGRPIRRGRHLSIKLCQCAPGSTLPCSIVGADLKLERRAAGPAEVEGGRVFLVALGADDRRARGRAEERVDQLARSSGVIGALHPDLRQRGLDRQLPRDARRVGVENARADAVLCEQVREELRLGKVRGRPDAFQKRIDSIALTPSSLIPERLVTLV